MPAVPLGTKAYRRTDAFVPEARLVNLWLEKDESGVSPDGVMRVQRPGITAVTPLGAAIRGLDYRVTTDESLSVAGGQLFSGGAAKGAIIGAGLAPMVGTSFVYVVLGGSTLYLYDTAPVAVTMPDDAGEIVDIDQLNNYVLILTRSGKFYWMVPGETLVDPLNFATAESSPDRAVAVRRIGDEFWIFSEDSIEPWQSTGDGDAPFQRVSGRVYESGALERDTVRRFDNSVMWVSDNGQVCRGGAVPTVVSDNGLSERIRKRTGAMSAFTFDWDGHAFYVLRVPGQGTFGYDASTQSWCEFSTGAGLWSPVTGYTRDGMTVVGGDTGTVGRLDSNAVTDEGVTFERVVTGTVGFLGRTGRNNSLAIGLGSSADCTIRVRWKDGQDDFPDYYDELPVRAPMDVANIYRMGRPEQPYRTVEVSCVDPVRLRIAGAMINESWK